MAKNAKTTPKTGQAAEPLVVSQRQIDWLHSFRIPGTDEALKSLEQAGEITFSGGVGKNRVKVPTPASPCIVSQSAVDWYKAKFPEDGATDIERWTAAGDVIITDEKTPHTRYGAVCQRCYRTIPTDANYCPYCGRPVVPVTNFPEAAPIVLTSDEVAAMKQHRPVMAKVLDIALREGIVKIVDEAIHPSSRGQGQ